jgi:Putative auto-transporter adhesin, head GIN domain
MMRVLTMIAVSGFLLCVVCLSAAVAIGGPDAIERGVWDWGPDWDWHWSGGHRIDHHGWRVREDGAQTTRTLTWTGGDTLDIQAPADVTFTQAPRPASVSVSGPRDAVDDVEIEDGRLRMRDPGFWHVGGLKAVMTAPDVQRFVLSGAGKLDIEGYNRDLLDVDVSGAGDIRANGIAKTLKLEISGAGAADTGGLKNETAEVELSGAGHATIAPTALAKIEISGFGDVNLLTRPAQVESHVSGMGHVHQPGGV